MDYQPKPSVMVRLHVLTRLHTLPGCPSTIAQRLGRITIIQDDLELIRKLIQPSSSRSLRRPDAARLQSWRPFFRNAPRAFGSA